MPRGDHGIHKWTSQVRAVFLKQLVDSAHRKRLDRPQRFCGVNEVEQDQVSLPFFAVTVTVTFRLGVAPPTL